MITGAVSFQLLLCMMALEIQSDATVIVYVLTAVYAQKNVLFLDHREFQSPLISLEFECNGSDEHNFSKGSYKPL